MRLLAFSILLLVFGGFGTMFAVIAYHLKRYSVPGDATARILKFFLIGSGFFVLLVIILFLIVPWDTLRVSLPSL